MQGYGLDETDNCYCTVGFLVRTTVSLQVFRQTGDVLTSCLIFWRTTLHEINYIFTNVGLCRKCITSVLWLLRYLMISRYRMYNFRCCYSIRRLYINSSYSSKHKKALSRFSNVESLIEMFPITECRVLEACKARRVNTMLIHTSINRWKEQPSTFTASRSTTDWSMNQ